MMNSGASESRAIVDVVRVQTWNLVLDDDS